MSLDTGALRKTEPAEAPAIHDDPPGLVGERAVTLFGIGWEGFETIAKLKGDRRVPRLIYSEGSLTQVAPGYRHEVRGDRLDSVVQIICEELDVPFKPAASTLFKRAALDRGVEGDRTYYFANEGRIEGDRDLDLETDPPPDLAIEVEVSHPAREALEVWRSLRVPEVWVYRVSKKHLTFLRLDEGGAYVEAPSSRALPYVTAAEVRDRVEDIRVEPKTQWLRRVRQWVRDELAPRVAQGEAPR